MKLRIILIEDKKNEQEQWRAMLKEWEKRSSVLVNAEIFDSAEAFLESDQNHTSNIHAIFLDISLSGINGIEAAKRIREARIQSDIIFLTAYREYVFDGYSVDAMDYLLKPLSQSIFDKCLRKLLDRYMNGTYIFRSNNEIIQIPYCDILYLSSRAHNVEITTLQGTISHRRNIKDLLSILPSNFEPNRHPGDSLSSLNKKMGIASCPGGPFLIL